MTEARFMPIFAVVFAISFALLYWLAIENNWALFTYHPALEEFGWLVQKPREGPAMYWYGWLTSAALGAAAVAALIARLNKAGSIYYRSANLSWAVPLIVMIAFVYTLRRYFWR